MVSVWREHSDERRGDSRARMEAPKTEARSSWRLLAIAFVSAASLPLLILAVRRILSTTGTELYDPLACMLSLLFTSHPLQLSIDWKLAPVRRQPASYRWLLPMTLPTTPLDTKLNLVGHRYSKIGRAHV